MTLLLFLILAFCVPAAVLFLVHRYRWAASAGAVVLCYLAGLFVGATGLLPDEISAMQSKVSEIAIAMALPMILMSLDVVAWSRIAGRALISMLFAIVSVMLLATVLAWAYSRAGVSDAAELAGLSVGVYTGGTANLAAIKTALDVSSTRFLVFVAFDTVVGAFFLMFMLSFGKRVFARWLPARSQPSEVAVDVLHDVHNEDFRQLLNRHGLAGIAKSIGVAAVLVVLAILTGRLLEAQESVAAFIALLTTFAIAASFLPFVRGIAESYKVGTYLIYVFSFAVASMISLSDIRYSDASILGFIVATIFGALLLHATLCRLARIDVDTFLVTSVAAVCSPPFVPLMARSLGNSTAILSGITTGIIGYALGTYLGISLGLMLTRLL
jgi:uncharacterized membrane protein